MARGKQSMQDALPAVVAGINASPTEALGNTAPDDLKSDPIAVFRQLQRNVLVSTHSGEYFALVME